MRMVLRLAALALLIGVAVAFFTYSSMEDKILSPAYRSSDASAGRTVEYPIKGVSAYITPEENGRVSGAKTLMFGGFAALIALGLLDYLLPKKK